MISVVRHRGEPPTRKCTVQAYIPHVTSGECVGKARAGLLIFTSLQHEMFALPARWRAGARVY